MFHPTQPQFKKVCGKEHTLVPDETLHMLNVVLKTAFRMHCTGETVCGKGPWQLVRDVQQKLLELSRRPVGIVSEERLTRYVAKELSGPERNAFSPLKLVGAE
jgi:hypothetical protein